MLHGFFSETWLYHIRAGYASFLIKSVNYGIGLSDHFGLIYWLLLHVDTHILHIAESYKVSCTHAPLEACIWKQAPSCLVELMVGFNKGLFRNHYMGKGCVWMISEGCDSQI